LAMGLLAGLQTNLAAIWAWLGTNSAAVQALSAIVFGLSTVFVAILAALIAHRQNSGLKPFVLMRSYGIGYSTVSKANQQSVEFEVWNRRKYPVTFVAAQVSYKHVKFFVDEVWNYNPVIWQPARDNELSIEASDDEVPVPPGDKKVLEVSWPIVGQTSSEKPRIRVWVFDPIKARATSCECGGDNWSELVRSYGLWAAMKMKLLGQSARQVVVIKK
jgi:hypothetical protein